MIKTLLVLSGAVLLASPSLLAQGRHYEGGNRGAVGRPVIDRARHGGGYGYGGRHNYGRYYYYGGVPYFYPFYGYGFGYGGGWYGDGFGGPYGYEGGAGYPGAYEGGAGYPGTYEGRVVNPNGRDTPPAGNGGALPEAVQRQLAKKGYYRGSIDGQFGPASRSALSRFQRERNLKETGRIDEPTLDALGFTDRQ